MISISNQTKYLSKDFETAINSITKAEDRQSILKVFEDAKNNMDSFNVSWERIIGDSSFSTRIKELNREKSLLQNEINGN